LFGVLHLRGLSLLYLPFTLQNGAAGLGVFAVFYGLDWIATVPPTVKLTSQAFGRENTGVIYGWIWREPSTRRVDGRVRAGSHPDVRGGYELAFWMAGVLCVLAGLAFLTIGRRSFPPLHG
jgi:hypothetical protein